ncbi:MAG: NAD(P)/FAD-dependent oxidoreductase [Pedosphaera sp.]|nr:NAD(P)/FAD-dependent oxidoreductase [Pedosphaera sp.]
MNQIEFADVVVIGGGPAGCATATVLGEQGHRVIVFEREKFPRYHIGESLIPFTYPALERIGMIPKLRASAFTRKYSVQFVAPSGRASQPFYFYTRYDRETVAQTWQVLRSEFDQMLMENAREKGAEVREETTVVEVIREGDRTVGVRVQESSGRQYDVRSAVVVDASGREAIAATRNAWRRGDPKLNKVAVWTYYRNSMRDSDVDEGQTTVAFIPEKGWFWHIPQHNDMVSVGVVAEGKYLTRGGVRDPQQIFEREIGENKWIESRLATGQCTGKYWLTAEYTFRSEYCAADGLVLVGDAFGFLDPVFSSGLMLALKSGVMAADAIHDALERKRVVAGDFLAYGQVMREGIENMRKLVYAFYDPNVSFKTVTEKFPEVHGDIIDCLSGDVNKDFGRLFRALSEWTEVPSDLPYGAPKPETGTALEKR